MYERERQRRTIEAAPCSSIELEIEIDNHFSDRCNCCYLGWLVNQVVHAHSLTRSTFI